MTEDYYSSAAQPRSGGILKAVLGTALLAYSLGLRHAVDATVAPAAATPSTAGRMIRPGGPI